MSRISDLAGFTTALSTTQDLSVGVITATSFSGDGSGLTGVASTDNIQTATDAKFLANVNITGVTTATGGFKGDLTGNVTGNTSGTAGGLTGTPNITVGSVTAASGSFSGNVTIGGTLTYQDVTNIDSVGIITAQQGIQVLANGVDVTGIGTFEDRITYDGSLEQAGGGTVTYTVTVASKDSTHRYNGQGSGNAYVIDNLQAPVLTLTPGRTYRFNHDNTGSHPLKFYYQADRTTLYTTGVTFDNSYTEIVVTDTTPAVLHYQCTNHALMGNAVFTQSNPIVGAGITLNADGGGVHVTGIVTATSFSGSGANLTDINASPSFEATADGSISDGAPVIIQTNGTVKAVGESPTTGTPTVKDRQQFHDDQSRNNCAFYDSGTDKIVNIFKDVNNGQNGTYIVGTFSGSSVSWGSEGTFPNTGSNSQPAHPEYTLATEVATSKWVIAFTDGNNNNYPTAVVATINSDNTITFGTPTVIDSNYGLVMGFAYDDNAGKVMVLYRSTSAVPYARVGTVSGTSISFGSGAALNDGGWSSNSMHMAYDSNANKFLAVWTDPNSSNRLEATVLSISGTSVSIDSLTNFTTSSVGTIQPRVVFDPNTNKFVIAFQNSATVGKAYVATISGNNVSVGSEQSLFDATDRLFDAKYNPDTNEIIFTNLNGSNDGQIRGVKINGTDLTLGSVTTFEAEKYPYDVSLAYDTSVDRFVATYANLTDNTGEYRVLVNAATNLTATNYIGISDGAYTNGQTATIQVAGSVDDAQSGLTPATIYYVQDSGGIAATESNPSVVAGQAIAATKLLIK